MVQLGNLGQPVLTWLAIAVVTTVYGVPCAKCFLYFCTLHMRKLWSWVEPGLQPRHFWVHGLFPSVLWFQSQLQSLPWCVYLLYVTLPSASASADVCRACLRISSAKIPAAHIVSTVHGWKKTEEGGRWMIQDVPLVTLIWVNGEILDYSIHDIIQ